MFYKIDQSWQADLARWGSWRSLLKEQSLWAIRVYRFGQRIDKTRSIFLKKIFSAIYWILFQFIETLLATSIPKEASIGPGLKIWHFGNIFIHPSTRIGSYCTLRQGVTLGNRYEGGAAPVIGDNVNIGMNSAIIGGVKVGNNCKIGAMSLVLCDVPDGATAVGVPARIIMPD